MAPGQLELLTGINERRWWEPGYPLSHGAAAAAKKALAAADLTAQDIDVLIYAGVCRGAIRAGHRLRRRPRTPDQPRRGHLRHQQRLPRRPQRHRGHRQPDRTRPGPRGACRLRRDGPRDQRERHRPDGADRSRSSSSANRSRRSPAVPGRSRCWWSARSCRARSGGGIVGGVTQNAPEYHALCRWGVQVALARDAFTRSRRSSGSRPARSFSRASTSACGTSWSRSWRRTPAKC